MKFLDANIFIYAYYKPKRQLSAKILKKKEESQKIIEKLENNEEEFITTIVHISEIINILKRGLDLEDLINIIANLFIRSNIEIVIVTPELYMESIDFSRKYFVDPNDALAIYLMKEKEISEIYSFDEGFDNLPGIIRNPIIK